MDLELSQIKEELDILKRQFETLRSSVWRMQDIAKYTPSGCSTFA